ncbi:hypothetical protein PENSPDRAFT_662720 [Peniophora sp. CONT]|nr:hypothetical protein PENSPDRAFT_662720 [Peniophora sp. CONT]
MSGGKPSGMCHPNRRVLWTECLSTSRNTCPFTSRLQIESSAEHDAKRRDDVGVNETLKSDLYHALYLEVLGSNGSDLVKVSIGFADFTELLAVAVRVSTEDGVAQPHAEQRTGVTEPEVIRAEGTSFGQAESGNDEIEERDERVCGRRAARLALIVDRKKCVNKTAPKYTRKDRQDLRQVDSGIAVVNLDHATEDLIVVFDCRGLVQVVALENGDDIVDRDQLEMPSTLSSTSAST